MHNPEGMVTIECHGCAVVNCIESQSVTLWCYGVKASSTIANNCSKSVKKNSDRSIRFTSIHGHEIYFLVGFSVDKK